MVDDLGREWMEAPAVTIENDNTAVPNDLEVAEEEEAPVPEVPDEPEKGDVDDGSDEDDEVDEPAEDDK